MKFDQFKDGSGRLRFTEREVKIINEKKCLTFTPEFFKHFKNMLMSIVVNFERFNKNKKFQKLMSEAKDEIESK